MMRKKWHNNEIMAIVLSYLLYFFLVVFYFLFFFVAIVNMVNRLLCENDTRKNHEKEVPILITSSLSIQESLPGSSSSIT